MGARGSCCIRNERDLQNNFHPRPRSVMEVSSNKYCISADNSEKAKNLKRRLSEKTQMLLSKNIYGKEEYPKLRLRETPQMSFSNDTRVSNADEPPKICNGKTDNDIQLVDRRGEKIDLERLDSQFICLGDSMLMASKSICSLKSSRDTSLEAS